MKYIITIVYCPERDRFLKHAQQLTIKTLSNPGLHSISLMSTKFTIINYNLYRFLKIIGNRVSIYQHINFVFSDLFHVRDENYVMGGLIIENFMDFNGNRYNVIGIWNCKLN